MTAPSGRAVFRLPRPAYLAVLFLALAVTALVQHPVFLVAYVIPILAIGFIARTATIVDADGITVRALFGSRHMRWDAVRGISVTGRNVYAVTDQGAVRLPCVRIRDLATLAAVSGGRLPELPPAKPKYAPARRRR